MDVPLRLWDVKTGRASGKSVEAQRINLAVDKIRVEVNHHYQELMQTDGYVTAAKLKDAYLGIGSTTPSSPRKSGTAGAGDIPMLSDGLQPYSGISAPYLQA